MQKHFLSALIAMLALSVTAWGQSAGPPGAKPPGGRHIFILHDGLHTILSDPDPTWATSYLRHYLRIQGVSDRDIIVMDFPFPIASWEDMFPVGALTYFLDSMNPASDASMQAYLRLDRALKQHGVRPDDRLIWIGHSAGGQTGLTLAHLGSTLAKYPDLARQSAPHPFDMVVTLGSPLAVDLAPASVKLRYYYSPKDFVVQMTCDYGHWPLKCLGYKADIMPTPPRLGKNALVRVFDDFGHSDWPSGPIVARILAEYRNDQRPAWRRSPLAPGIGPGLASLLGQAVEEQCRVSIEDPFE